MNREKINKKTLKRFHSKILAVDTFRVEMKDIMSRAGNPFQGFSYLYNGRSPCER